MYTELTQHVRYMPESSRKPYFIAKNQENFIKLVPVFKSEEKFDVEEFVTPRRIFWADDKELENVENFFENVNAVIQSHHQSIFLIKKMALEKLIQESEK